MARPGKSIFDVTMMAGWAFAAVLTGLVALTMVDDTDDSAQIRLLWQRWMAMLHAL